MNGAAFFLVVNFVVALSFSVVFVVVAMRSHSRTAAIWLGVGFGVASLSAICELFVAYAGPTRFWALCAFATVLCGMAMLTIGIAQMYGRSIPLPIASLYVLASVMLAYLIYELPRGTPMQALLYQGPFALVVLVGAMTVMLARQRTTLDLFLGILLTITSAHFVGKAGLAVWVGSGATAKDYVYTDYALISQSLTAVLIVTVGLTLLAKLVLEILAVHRTESEVDSLSGLANRRGFERQIHEALRQCRRGQHAIIITDLDHFKRINDTYGHHTGDQVIRIFAEALRSKAPQGSVVGRLGGEEFAVFLPQTSVQEARRLAQTFRLATMSLQGLPPALCVTASFGVAAVSSADDLDMAYRQADVALYRAKGAGRNRVELATSVGQSVAAPC
ncbi:diguanylate cyclase (GGDEF) domain-containing protein [Rhizobium sp. RU33A]|uniref:GGDEF domain-containing protein n=1 Tax=Rhizobium sp. RU33A TaxID=1907413 RepID=UPI00095654CF|nr:GGDEF domain-containing protein [Rhizobium sp. RU33A]SIQ89646.1 diguanylate cyclase (GGDEF) domain-containing protein [Rhizobium sp. RU33A]